MSTSEVQGCLHTPDPNCTVSPSNRASIHTLPYEILCHIFKLSHIRPEPQLGDDSDEENTLHFWDGHSSHPLEPLMERGAVKKFHSPLSEAGGSTASQVFTHAYVRPSLSSGANIASVCSYWRNIAIYIPSLWTTIVVSPNMALFDFVQTQLARSGDLPIDIHVDAGRHHDDFEEDLRNMYALLIPHAHRWRSIEVDVSANTDPINNTTPSNQWRTSAFVNAVARSVASPVPELISIRMNDFHRSRNMNTDRGWYHIWSSFLYLGLVHSLKSLVLCRSWLSCGRTNLTNLTSLELRNHECYSQQTWRDFTSLLRDTPSLKKLSICRSLPYGNPEYWVMPGETDHGPLQLPCLTDLTISYAMPRGIVGLLRNLDMPRLKTMTLHMKVHSAAEFFGALGGMPVVNPDDEYEGLYTLFSKLEHFAFTPRVDPDNTDSFEPLFNTLHHLKSLQLNLPIQPFKTREALKCLLPDANGAIRMPLLETLILGSDSDKITILLLDVVKRRKAAGFPLKSLYLQRTCFPFDDEDVRWFEENSVSVFTFCLCHTKSPVAGECFQHPKHTGCYCCPGEYLKRGYIARVRESESYGSDCTLT